MRRTHTTVTVGNTTTAVAVQNTKRRHLLLQNDSDEVIYIAFGQAAVLNTGIRLNAAGGEFHMYGDDTYPHSINAICASGSKKLLVTQGQ